MGEHTKEYHCSDELLAIVDAGALDARVKARAEAEAAVGVVPVKQGKGALVL